MAWKMQDILIQTHTYKHPWFFLPHVLHVQITHPSSFQFSCFMETFRCCNPHCWIEEEKKLDLIL